MSQLPFCARQRNYNKQGVTGIRLSSFYRTAPVGCAPDTPYFVNAVLTGEWRDSVEKLHELCKSIEEKAGRPRDHEHYGSRPLDLDIIFFGDEIISTPELTIPHREAANRLFVLVPLAEIAGSRHFPGRQELVRDTLSRYKGSAEYREFMAGSHPEFFPLG